MYSKLLEEFKRGPEEISKIVRSLPEGSIDYKPEREDSWTIRQHLIHLVDSDINNFIRIKSCIAQTGSDVYVIDEENWVKNLGDRKEDPDEYLEVFSLLRKILCRLLADLDPGGFKNLYFVRKYQNKTARITLVEALEMYRDHVVFHMKYIHSILDEIAGRQ